MCTRRVAIFILVFLVSPLVSAGPATVGTVSSCKGASIHGTPLVPGSTVFSGDTIDVSASGKAWIAVSGGGQVHVFENSSVRLIKSPNSIDLTIHRGEAETNGRAITINRSPALDSGASQVRQNVVEDKYRDMDCEVSRHLRRSRSCRDDSD